MYGTVARMRLEPGMEARLHELNRAFEVRQVPGCVAQHLYRMDADPNAYDLTVVFKSKGLFGQRQFPRAGRPVSEVAGVTRRRPRMV